MNHDVQDGTNLPLLEAVDACKRFSSKVRNLSKEDDSWALYRVNFTIRSSEFHVIEGSNGSGKSTLLKLLSGQYQPNQGEIRIQANTIRHWISSDPKPWRARLSVLENIRLCAGLAGVPSTELKKKLDFILDDSGLRQFQNYPSQSLSTGWRVRLMATPLYFRRPQLIFLDEPDAHLDLAGRRWLSGMLDKQLLLGAAIVISTPVALELSDKQQNWKLENGSLIAIDSPIHKEIA